MYLPISNDVYHCHIIMHVITHIFQWGINWSFAHNGEVPKYSNKPYNEYPLLGRVSNREEVFYHPVGDTDSEAVFCAILNALRAEFTELPTLPVL